MSPFIWQPPDEDHKELRNGCPTILVFRGNPYLGNCSRAVKLGALEASLLEGTGLELQSSLDVISVAYGTRGWGPISQLAQLAGQMFSSELIVVPAKQSIARLYWSRAAFPRLRSRRRGRNALLIVGVPGQLYALLEDPLWLGQYDSVAVWVIDSFWNERIPKVLRGTRRIDWIWVTDSNDVTDWQNFFGSRVGVLPWGTDAKAVNSDYPPGQKSVDLLRVGRQPIAYEDDELIKADASKLGVSFAGRPNFGSNEDESSRNLHSALAESKAVLAFSNIYDTTTYTHPSKEYVTGRWMDSLAHGAAVAGVLPNTDTARSLVPPIGRILLDARDREAGLRSVRDWAEEWHLGTSTEIRKFAIENLDWRHRLSVVDKHFELHSETLANEIVELKRISANLDVR